MAMSFWCTEQVGAMCASCSVVFHRILGDIVLRCKVCTCCGLRIGHF